MRSPNDPEKQKNEWRRKAAVAGRFYPGSAKALEDLLRDYLTPAETPLLRPLAVIAPHAGYIYSGRIAGEIYRRIEVPNRVVILCPNHTGDGARISVWAKGAWETPLGDVPVDEALADAIIERSGGTAQADRNAHLFEHAIEVHLPFLLARNPRIQIVPIVLGRLKEEDALRFGEALAGATSATSGDLDTLIVASTDMSHYVSADNAKKYDAPALDAIAAMDGSLLYQTVVQNDISMCGFIPTATAIFAAKKLGASTAKIISYGNSGDASGDYDQVVAYASGYLK